MAPHLHVPLIYLISSLSYLKISLRIRPIEQIKLFQFFYKHTCISKHACEHNRKYVEMDFYGDWDSESNKVLPFPTSLCARKASSHCISPQPLHLTSPYPLQNKWSLQRQKSIFLGGKDFRIGKISECNIFVPRKRPGFGLIWQRRRRGFLLLSIWGILLSHKGGSFGDPDRLTELSIILWLYVGSMVVVSQARKIYLTAIP